MIGLLVALAALDVAVRGDKSVLMSLYKKWQENRAADDKMRSRQ